MATNQNNVHINSFSKGMNSDTSLDAIDKEQYTYAENIRLTTNTALGIKNTSNVKEGIVVPIAYGESLFAEMDGIYTDCEILATASIDDVGVMIIKDKDHGSKDDSYPWQVYKITRDGDNLKSKKIFESNTYTKKNKFSVVINKETEDVTKLYIADGENEVMQLILESDKNITYDVDDLISNRYFPAVQARIAKKIRGRLKTSQVQYTYRFYRKHSVKSKFAPITKRIQIIDGNRNREQGNAEDTETSVGLRIEIPIGDTVYSKFDHIQVFRIQYTKPNEDANINLIYDAKLNDNKTVVVNDTGIVPLQEYSIEEFLAQDSMSIIPQCIEQNQNYLFYGNTEDQTQLKTDNLAIDSRSYSFNADNEIPLYQQSDTEFSEGYTVFPSIAEINNKLYTLNICSDMRKNITTTKSANEDSTNEDDVYVRDYKCGRYCSDGYTLGGEGVIVNWKFVVLQIPLDDNPYSHEPPYTKKENLYCSMYYLRHDVDEQGRAITRFENIQDVDISDILKGFGISNPDEYSYNDIFVSSCFKSLRRDETYRYGIVYYDKYGRRTDVQWIADIRTPSAEELPLVRDDNNTLYSLTLGLQFDVNVEEISDDIVAYQIVRCEKSTDYSKNILQVVLSRPVDQIVYTDTGNTGMKTPYYPQYLLSSAPVLYYAKSHEGDHPRDWGFFTQASNVHNWDLFQMFCPEINVIQDDTLTKLQSSTNIKSIYGVFGNPLKDDAVNIYGNAKSVTQITYDRDTAYLIRGHQFMAVYYTNKADQSYVHKYYNNRGIDTTQELKSTKVEQIKTVSTPKWNDIATNVQISGGKIMSGVLSYKSFATSISNKNYVNWNAAGLYNLRVSTEQSQAGVSGYNAVLLTTGQNREEDSLRFVGPGPRCMLIKTEYIDKTKVKDAKPFAMELTGTGTYQGVNTRLCNIQHSPTQFAGFTDAEKQYDVYYGFGDFATINEGKSQMYVFDGDVYITLAEIVTMYKTYNMMSYDTVPSAQFIYYVPMESIINTCFNYGMNYRNTQSKTVMLEPGEITGIVSQDRPQYQYNMIYSDNSRSNDVYNAQTVEDNTDVYQNRIMYSELKTAGENIDSWSEIKTLNYIDTDSRHGEITNLLTSKDTLYYWQTQAFGRITVNERSLITDQNNNTIQLGQGGVLQKADYVTTKYGMRRDDFCALSANDLIFWIDVDNTAIVTSNGQAATNYGETTFVQNILNESMSKNTPLIDHDLQNDELLCKCLSNGHQLVFNIKSNIATSVYTRDYIGMIQFCNTLYGFDKDLSCYRYNNIKQINGYMPTILSFVVNNTPVVSKVFDDQQIITAQRLYDEQDEFFENKTFEFGTDIYEHKQLNIEGSTNREGNLCYAVPRFDNGKYGGRMRGKWMTETIKEQSPKNDYAIAHILTKFRQSFS